MVDWNLGKQNRSYGGLLWSSGDTPGCCSHCQGEHLPVFPKGPSLAPFPQMLLQLFKSLNLTHAGEGHPSFSPLFQVKNKTDILIDFCYFFLVSAFLGFDLKTNVSTVVTEHS